MTQKPRADKHHCQEQSNKGDKQRQGIRTLAEQYVSRRLNCRHKHHCREGIIQHQVIQTRDLISIEFFGTPCEIPQSQHKKHGQENSRSEEHTSELQSLAYLVCRL